MNDNPWVFKGIWQTFINKIGPQVYYTMHSLSKHFNLRLGSCWAPSNSGPRRMAAPTCWIQMRQRSGWSIGGWQVEVLNKDIKEASIILTDLQVSLLWIGDSTDTDTDNTDNVSLQCVLHSCFGCKYLCSIISDTLIPYLICWIQKYILFWLTSLTILIFLAS